MLEPTAILCVGQAAQGYLLSLPLQGDLGDDEMFPGVSEGHSGEVAVEVEMGLPRSEEPGLGPRQLHPLWRPTLKTITAHGELVHSALTEPGCC